MKQINAQFVHSRSLGYGRMGVDLTAALAARGVAVYDHLPMPGVETPEGRIAKRTNAVCWMSTPSHAVGWWKGMHTSLLTMFESDTLPESFRQSLDEFDQIIVPSYQNLELFGAYHDRVTMIPLGVDPIQWAYVPRKEPGQFFNFLTAGSGSRKGTDLTFKAFQKVFATWPKDGPIPRLIMKNPRNEPFIADNVEIIPGRVTDAEEIAIYARAHAYVQPSRGEGFGLQPLQAIAQGIPTILTAAHGHDSFAHLGYGLDATKSKADYFIFGDAGEWWEPNFDQLCEYMAYLYLNWEEAFALAEKNSKTALEDFTWDKMAERFIDCLGDALDVEYSGSGEWYTPSLRRYRLRVRMPWLADMAGVSHYFEPGRDYWETADVKRILFEASVLDPECLDDEGLLPSQVERIPDYTATRSFCPTCNTRLGTGERRSDVILADRQSHAD